MPRDAAEPPSTRPSRRRSGQLQAAASVEAFNSRQPARSPVRSQGRRKPIHGGSGRGVPAELRVEVQYAQRPRGVPAPVALRRWARGAYAVASAATTKRASGNDATACTLTVRVVGRAESHRLNRAFRGKDKPTNVLSFPASPEERRLGGALGDLAICAPIVAQEAREQGKALSAHWAHMVVHGTLHLLGHDHERTRAARAMEALEVEILRGFGFDDPYVRVARGRV